MEYASLLCKFGVGRYFYLLCSLLDLHHLEQCLASSWNALQIWERGGEVEVKGKLVVDGTWVRTNQITWLWEADLRLQVHPFSDKKQLYTGSGVAWGQGGGVPP